MTPREFETSPLVFGAGGLWPQAIYADFLSAIGDGELPREAFERWLVQGDGHAHEDQQQYFNEVLRHERYFWRMTWEG